MKTKAVSPRHVAVAIPFYRPPWPSESNSINTHASTSTDTVMICLVSSRKHKGHWVLPKGGVEHGETSRQAAIREMREEAGLIPLSPGHSNHAHSLPSGPRSEDTIADHKPHKDSPSSSPSSPTFVPRAIYTSHLIEVGMGKEGEAEEWEEERERKREWVGLEEAKKRIEWRRDIALLLERARF